MTLGQRRDRVRDALLSTAAISLISVAVPTYAHAQQGEQGPFIEEVLVTGSRIARPELQASSPVNIVTTQDIQFSGSTNVEQFLNELPQLAPSASATTNNGGEGIATIDLRGLGSNRTLVLVNGRRFVASNFQGEVDINNIPASLIERVDIVTGGASAIYGSDAIAGVVNFIMKRDFEGFEIGGQYSATDGFNAEMYDTNITAGTNFADGRGNIVFYGSYSKRHSLLQGERKFSREALGDTGGPELEPLGSSRIAGGLIPADVDFGNGVVDWAMFTPDGAIVPWDGSLYNFAPDNYLQTPQERWILNTMMHYKITPSIEAFGEFFYANNRVDLQLASDANDIPDMGTLQIALNNTRIPAATRAILGANFDPDGDGIAEISGFRRRMTENGPRLALNEFDTFRALGGFRGDIADGRFNWEAYYSFARTNKTEENINYTSDLRIQQGLLTTIDPVTGELVCTNPINGCVPLNIFGEGQVTEEMAAFMSPRGITRRETEQEVAGASISGDLFDLPAGPLGIAIGVEYRRESSKNRPDAVVQSGELGPGNDEAPTDGRFTVKEIYGETVIPIVSDVPFIHRLEAEAALRYSDYSTVGSVWTYKAGGQWAPSQDIRFRGLFQRAVRAPNIYELFGGRAAGADDFLDPCRAAANPSAQVQQFCIAQGVPAALLPTFLGDPGGQATTVFGGNPDLLEEKSNTYTIGAVLTPSFIDGLSLTIDYYYIKLDGAIDDLDAATVGRLCFDSLDLANPFCQAITRDPANGLVTEILASRANLAVEKREGIDWQISYTFDLPGLAIGDAGASIQLFHVGNRSFTNKYQPVEGENYINCNGTFGAGCTGLNDFAQPKIRTTTQLTYMSDPIMVRAQMRHLGKLRNLNAESLAVPSVGSQFYFDLVANFQATESLDFTLGVDNVFDNAPPILGDAGPDANTDPSLYDVFGRRIFLAARARF